MSKIKTQKNVWNMFSKLTIQVPKRRHRRRSGILIVNFEHISHFVFVFLFVELTVKCLLEQIFMSILPLLLELQKKKKKTEACIKQNHCVLSLINHWSKRNSVLYLKHGVTHYYLSIYSINIWTTQHLKTNRCSTLWKLSLKYLFYLGDVTFLWAKDVKYLDVSETKRQKTQLFSQPSIFWKENSEELNLCLYHHYYQTCVEDFCKATTAKLWDKRNAFAQLKKLWWCCARDLLWMTNSRDH